MVEERQRDFLCFSHLDSCCPSDNSFGRRRLLFPFIAASSVTALNGCSLLILSFLVPSQTVGPCFPSILLHGHFLAFSMTNNMAALAIATACLASHFFGSIGLVFHHHDCRHRHRRCPSARSPSNRQSCKPLRCCSSTTETTLTVPSFLDAESEHGSYPSPLHRIHIRSVLSDEETAHSLQLAKDYAATTGCWEQPDQERHATYSTCDFAVDECGELVSYLDEIALHERLWTHLSNLYGIAREDMNFLDFFCAHYQANSDDDHDDGGAAAKTMDRLEAHRDGSLLSFTITLNSPDDFEGGGTFFDALRDAEPTDVLRRGAMCALPEPVTLFSTVGNCCTAPMSCDPASEQSWLVL